MSNALGLLMVGSAIMGMYLICWVLMSVQRIHYRAFWWSTNNGLRYSSSEYRRLKYLKFIKWVHHDCDYRHPKEHPEYKLFKEEIKKL